MEIFLSVFQAVAIMFGIGIIGFAIIHKRMVDANVFGLMVPLVVDIALPCLIFFNIISKFDPDKIFKLWQFPVAWIMETIFFLILALIFSKISKINFRKEFTISLFYQNGIFFPIIILSQIYGENSYHLVNLFIFTIFYPTFFFNTYSFFYKKDITVSKKDFFKEIFNLAMIATIAGLLIKISGGDKFLPDFIYKV
jgi:predicted permease